MANTGAPVGDPRPLLAFASPVTGKIPPSDGPNKFRPVQRPSAGRQGTHITPQFDALRSALEGGRAQLAGSTNAPDPELVAVFDLAGAVDGFLSAASGVEGLEFLAELQEDYVESDDDFFYEAKGERSDDGVPQSLYMVMTNAQAVTELVRLFELWQQDPKVKFATGLNPLKDVFGKSTHTRPGNPYLKGALGIAAMSASRSHGTCYSAKYRRIASRRGPVKAIVAVEHAMLIAIWNILTMGALHSDPGDDFYARVNRQGQEPCPRPASQDGIRRNPQPPCRRGVDGIFASE